MTESKISAIEKSVKEDHRLQFFFFLFFFFGIAQGVLTSKLGMPRVC